MLLENSSKKATVRGTILYPPGRSDLQQFDDDAFHRWYPFVLGFSDQLVDSLLEKFGVKNTEHVLDPFCGSGTTLIECAKRKIPSIGIDANPFAVFTARAKSEFRTDPDAVIAAATRVRSRYRKLVSSNRRFTDEAVYKYLDKSGMLKRGWISPKPLRKALVLREAIRRCKDERIASLFLLALAADLPTNIGNMKFGPQIYRGKQKKDVDPIPFFSARVKAIVEDLRSSNGRRSYAAPVSLLGDARSLKPVLRRHFSKKIPKIRFVICSPPYPTEHDYTRHTRLELAFIDSVSTRQSLRSVKRGMIRSHTKGIYQDDLDDQRAKKLPSVNAVSRRVAKAIKGKTSGFEKLYPTVVKAYFGGMKRHFGSLFRLMEAGGRAAYVVGDQAAYMRVPIRTAVLLGEAAESVGFKVEKIELWRRRWSTGIKKHLDENILFLIKP